MDIPEASLAQMLDQIPGFNDITPNDFNCNESPQLHQESRGQGTVFLAAPEHVGLGSEEF